MFYGYIRVSTPRQNIERQNRNILNAYPNCDRIYSDHYTGTKMDRPSFKQLLKVVKSGDTIVFDSVSRMSRDAAEGVKQYFDLYDKGIELVFLNEPQINTATYKQATEKSISHVDDDIANIYIDATNKVLRLLAKKQIELAFDQAEKEVKDLQERTRQGLKTAKINGKVLGRRKGEKVPPKKKAERIRTIKKLSKDMYGSNKDTELIKMLNIARNTYYRYKKEAFAEYLNESGTTL